MANNSSKKQKDINSALSQQVLGALENVIDPELGIDVVNLGLIYKIDVRNGYCIITMTLTIMGCPLSDLLDDQIKQAATSVEGINSCKINLVWEPAWNIHKMSHLAKMALGIHD